MRRNSNGAKTKELISLAVYQLMLRHNYDDITVKDICAKANVSRMSFYRYYNQKDDIFVVYCDTKFEEFFDEFAKVKDPTLEDFYCAVFKYMKQNSRQLLMLKKAKRERLLVTQFDNYAKYITTKIKFTNLKDVRNNPYFVSYMSGGLFNSLMKWIDKGMKETPEEMTKFIIDINEN